MQSVDEVFDELERITGFHDQICTPKPNGQFDFSVAFPRTIDAIAGIWPEGCAWTIENRTDGAVGSAWNKDGGIVAIRHAASPIEALARCLLAVLQAGGKS